MNSRQPAPSLSIVIPAYNEALRIGPTLDELAELLAANAMKAEVVVVDDGSIDDTAAVAQRHLSRFPQARVISGELNRGKGHAVRTGMLAATGDLRLFLDADGSTDSAEILRFVARASRPDYHSTVLIGSVAMAESQVTPQPGIRPLVGRLGNWLIRVLVVRGIRDTQRGFKLFPADVAETVFALSTIDGWLFDVEVLAISQALGFPVLELPVSWEHREDSRVTSRSYVRSLGDLFRLRFRLWRNSYGLRPPQPVRVRDSADARVDGRVRCCLRRTRSSTRNRVDGRRHGRGDVTP